MNTKQLKIALAACIVALLIPSVFLMTSCSSAGTEQTEEPTSKTETSGEKTTAAEGDAEVVNPLTGIAKGFDKNALKRRTVAIVVENTPDARPQWGMDDKKYAPDIILEGEVEGGITRTLWFYADYKKVPKIIGPMRSARPPFIRFSELFDSIFVHWGQSHSKGNYIGANTIFRKHHVQHINGMDFSNKCGLYDRDNTRNV
ncbi:MAG: DUF3048 domain-containing protein, partial [Eubacterium sp.]|nr:DUF3048 domain-containing protein [Eubacterium sp.]